MKNLNVKPNEKKETVNNTRKINNLIDELERIKDNPVLISEIKERIDFIPEVEHTQVISESIKSIEDMSFYLRFKNDETLINPFRNLNKIVDKEVNRIKVLDFKAIDKIIDRKHKCVSFLYKKFVDMKMKSYEVNYDYYDKLTGFMTKKGRFKWSNDKIDELFVSLMK